MATYVYIYSTVQITVTSVATLVPSKISTFTNFVTAMKSFWWPLITQIADMDTVQPSSCINCQDLFAGADYSASCLAISPLGLALRSRVPFSRGKMHFGVECLTVKAGRHDHVLLKLIEMLHSFTMVTKWLAIVSTPHKLAMYSLGDRSMMRSFSHWNHLTKYRKHKYVANIYMIVYYAVYIIELPLQHTWCIWLCLLLTCINDRLWHNAWYFFLIKVSNQCQHSLRSALKEESARIMPSTLYKTFALLQIFFRLNGAAFTPAFFDPRHQLCLLFLGESFNPPRQHKCFPWNLEWQGSCISWLLPLCNMYLDRRWWHLFGGVIIVRGVLGDHDRITHIISFPIQSPSLMTW